MPRMTVHVPDDLMKRLRKRHPETNWAEVARNIVKKKIEELEKFEKLKKEGKL